MSKQWLIDTIERTVATYLEVLFGLLIAQWTTDKLDFTLLSTAALAAVPAALTVLKSAIAELRDGTVSPASLASTPGS
ncbi:MAG TPA: hypothetical protein VGE43_19475 [Acidimicrobiales bacterium]